MIRSNVGIVTLRLTFDEHWIGYHLKVACNKCDGGRRRGSCPRECGPMTRRESRSATPDRVSTLHRGAREVARRRTTPGNEPGAAVCTIAAIGPTPVRLYKRTAGNTSMPWEWRLGLLDGPQGEPSCVISF